jgi:tetratricopeptide (TPR) repeat protein
MRQILAVLILLSPTLYGQGNEPAQIGNEFFKQGQYTEALSEYEKLPQAEKNAAILNRMGISYHLLNRLKEAEAAYNTAIRRDQALSEAYNNLGVLYYSRKTFGEAERQFRRALEQNPDSSTAKSNLRAARHARENGRRARDLAAEFEKERPLLVEQRLDDQLSARILIPQKDLEQANLHDKRGDSFLARKMFEDAIIEYQKALEIDRYNASIVNRLGLAYHQSQKLREAEQQYRDALRLNPVFIEALNNLGTVEYTNKRYNQALEQYNKALKIRPESPTILQNVGACLFAMERFDEGVKVYQHALAIDPQLFEHISSFGTLIQTAHRNDSMLNFYLAKVFATSGDKDRAISYLYKAYEEGFKDREQIKAEPAFMILVEDERFIKLMETMAANASGPAQ